MGIVSEDRTVRWLLGKDQPAVRHRVLTDILGLPHDNEDVGIARDSIARRGWARDILRAQRKDGTWVSGEDLYYPKYLATNWMMLVLTDLGLTSDCSGVKRGCDLFFSRWLKPGHDESEYEVCVAGNLARMLVKCGYADDSRVRRLIDWLIEAQKADGGWHCFPSDAGTLDCWEALAAFASIPRSRWNGSIRRSVERGAEFYLERKLFNEGRRYAPWLRFHYPTHYYYDVLVGLDILTALGYGNDSRLGPALKLLQDRRLSNGTWALDAVHPDISPGAKYTLRVGPTPFALEKAGIPSKWITLTALTILKRAADA